MLADRLSSIYSRSISLHKLKRQRLRYSAEKSCSIRFSAVSKSFFEVLITSCINASNNHK
jgi:hypothetical protein